MKRRLIFLSVCVSVLISLSACTIRSNSKLSDDEIDDMIEEYEEYLEETYPDETFTVEVWQEYGEDVGGAGLPDYEGYLIRQVITDSEGNRFKITKYSNGDLVDDYQNVLDGKVRYDKKGLPIFTDDD